MLSTRQACDLRRLYGVGAAEYTALYAKQGGVCAACGNPPAGGRKTALLHVDHDHETGRVRGLLCNGCNCALGHLCDDPARIDALKAYLSQTTNG